VYERIIHGLQEENYHLQGKLLYHVNKLCIPEDERMRVIREAHISHILGNFGVGKTRAHLHRFCYWPQMRETISRYVKGCVLCATSKPSNRKLGLYTPILVPSQP